MSDPAGGTFSSDLERSAISSLRRHGALIRFVEYIPAHPRPVWVNAIHDLIKYSDIWPYDGDLDNPDWQGVVYRYGRFQRVYVTPKDSDMTYSVDLDNWTRRNQKVYFEGTTWGGTLLLLTEGGSTYAILYPFRHIELQSHMTRIPVPKYLHRGRCYVLGGKIRRGESTALVRFLTEARGYQRVDF